MDRLVGYELSPVLWKKVRGGLSAGRVQSVAVRLIVEREREIENFKPSDEYRLSANFELEGSQLVADGKLRPKAEEEAMVVLEAAKGATFNVASLDEKPGKRSPGAPFTTSTLQQEAARRLGFSVRTTMSVAQKLYESGHITYMRTDSLNLSPLAVDSIGKFIREKYGDKYHSQRQYRTKTSGAQEAHEAIRPTHVDKLTAGNDDLQKKLYSLIWQRTVASQMTAAEVLKSVLSIKMSNHAMTFEAKGEVLKFDGYLSVYGGGKDDVILPPIKVGEELKLDSLEARQTFSKPTLRYSEASLVRKLEELGIGRPSTYAPTISTIQSRGYVEKGDVEGVERKYRLLKLSGGRISSSEETEIAGNDKGKLLPTALALMANDFLVKYFAPIVDYDFTKEVEEEFDLIADGREGWQEMIKRFYHKDFHPLIDASANVSRSETSHARELGNDPKTGKPIIARFGRFGPMLQMGEATDDEKPAFAPLPAGARLETVTFEQALEMFKLPRIVGTTKDGREIKANIGRFGPYVQVDKVYVSIKGHDPLKISEAEAKELIEAKLEAEAKKLINEFGDIKVLNGMYGPYVTDGKKNAKIPKDTDPKSITEEQAKQMIAEAPEKGKGRFGRRKAAPAATTTKRTVKRKTTRKKA